MQGRTYKPLEVVKGRAKITGSVTQRALLDYVKQRHTLFNPPETSAMLACVVEAVKELLEDGNSVSIEGLGSFRPRVFKAAYKRRISVLFLPSPDLTRGLKEKKIVDVEPPDESGKIVTDKELKRRYDKRRNANK